MYNLVVNTNSPLATTILNTEDKASQEHLVKQALDLAKLSQNNKGDCFCKVSNDQVYILASCNTEELSNIGQLFFLKRKIIP
jgi:hypothetical protein